MDESVCRICLITGVKVYNFREDPLKSRLAQLQSVPVLSNDPDDMPPHACFECTAILLKCSKFLEKTAKAQEVLYKVLHDQGKITATTVKAIDRGSLQLLSELAIKKVNAFDITSSEFHENDGGTVIKQEFEDYDLKLDDEIVCDQGDYGLDYDGSEINVDIIDINLAKPMYYSKEDDQFDLVKEKIFVDIPIITNPTIIETPKSKTDKNRSPTKTKPSRKKSAKRKPMSKREEPRESKNVTNTKNKMNKTDKEVTSTEQELMKCFDYVTLTHEQQLEEINRRKESSAYLNAPYKCGVCYKPFQKLEPHNNHMVLHDPSAGPEVCPVCKKRYADVSTMLVHVRMNHECEYRCKLCPYVCKKRTAQTHLRSHEDFARQYKCEHCNYVTSNTHKYLFHRRSAHGRRFDCRRCGRGFVSQRGLLLHAKKSHANQEESVDTEEHPCHSCNIIFASETALRVHLLTSLKHVEKKNKGNVCIKCGEKFNGREELRKHNSEKHAPEKLYPRKCLHCDETMTSSREHWQHTRSAHPHQKTNYRSLLQHVLCEFCGRSFKSSTDLRIHVSRHSSSPSSPLTCPAAECAGAHFLDALQLRAHTRNVHPSRRPYECKLCQLTFKTKTNLNRHAVVHSGKKPYPCHICDKAFTQSGSRKLHVRTVHYNLPHPPRRRARRAQPPPTGDQ